MNKLAKTIGILLLAGFVSLLFYSCQSTYAGNNKSAAFSETANGQAAHPLQGTWKLLAAHWNADTKQFADNTIYKIYTANRFAFLFYNEATKTFSGGGGGTYTVDGDRFTEHLEYFSFDTTAVGSAQTYQFEIKDGIFHQSGTLNTDKYTDYTIHEFYERVEPGIGALSENHPLVGVWQVEEAAYGGHESDIAGRYGKVLKIITPGHFYVAYFNPETGYFNGLGFGSWNAEEDRYTETIKAYSWDASAVGQTVTFNWRVEGDRFFQSGKIDTDQYKDYEIKEVSRRLE